MARLLLVFGEKNYENLIVGAIGKADCVIYDDYKKSKCFDSDIPQLRLLISGMLEVKGEFRIFEIEECPNNGFKVIREVYAKQCPFCGEILIDF